jgi:UrcA family protein
MYTRVNARNARSVVGAAIIAGTLFAGEVVAREHDVTVTHRVSTQGLDLATPAGAHELYVRLQNAAWFVCTRGDRVDLRPVPDPPACIEKALGEGVHSVHQPLLTQVYLETHTLAQAASYGIEVPAQLSAKR